MAAPGVDIQATDVGGRRTTVTGTSAAAAHVAGSAALLAAIDSSASNGTIVGRLARNADALASGAAGNGRLNLARAAGDTATDEVSPTAPARSAMAGPLVGPYVAAANVVSVNDVLQAEGNAVNTMTFTVSTNGSGTGTVTYTTAPSGGNPATEGTGTCYPGEDTSKQLHLDLHGVWWRERAEVNHCHHLWRLHPRVERKFTVTLANPTPSGGSGMNIGDGIGIGTITNDDAANVAPVIDLNGGRRESTHASFTEDQVGATTLASGLWSRTRTTPTSPRPRSH